MYWIERDGDKVADARTIHEGDGAIKTRAYFEGVSQLPVKFQTWELGPGVSEGSHIHGDDRPLEEAYYFLEGRGMMWVDGEDFSVGAGDAVLVPPEADHGFRNTGDTPLKLIIIWGRPEERG